MRWHDELWQDTSDDNHNEAMMDALVSQFGPAYDFNNPKWGF